MNYEWSFEVWGRSCFDLPDCSPNVDHSGVSSVSRVLRVEIEIPLEVSYSSNMLLHLVKNVFHKAFPIQYY